MRDKNRMWPFLCEVQNEWKKVPDWRFGQLMYNFFCEKGDPFYWEEDKFIEKLREYIGDTK